MGIYKRVMNYQTPIFYPWAWAFILGAALGVGYVIGVALEIRRCMVGGLL